MKFKGKWYIWKQVIERWSWCKKNEKKIMIILMSQIFCKTPFDGLSIVIGSHSHGLRTCFDHVILITWNSFIFSLFCFSSGYFLLLCLSGNVVSSHWIISEAENDISCVKKMAKEKGYLFPGVDCRNPSPWHGLRTALLNNTSECIAHGLRTVIRTEPP